MRASEIEPKAIRWLWWPYLPLGKLTAIAGQMGQAKSLLTVWLAAAVSTGQEIDCSAGGVILLSAEDDREDTIRPRLEAAGADLDRVWIEPEVALDVDRLAHICDHEIADVRLVTIDPVQAYLPGNVNSWKGQDVRLALEPLRQLAADRSLAVALIQHLNRRTDTTDPLARIADSQGIPQLARSVLLWGPDPADEEGDQGDTKALTRAKANLARSGTTSATFTIAEASLPGGITAPTLIRGDDRAIAPDDIVADSETRTAQDEAVEWLRDLLADGPVDAKDALKRAREAGIAERTLKRAKRPAGAISESSRTETGIAGWRWRLKEPPMKTPGTLGTVGPQGPLAKEAKEANSPNNSNGANHPDPDAELQRIAGKWGDAA